MSTVVFKGPDPVADILAKLTGNLTDALGATQAGVPPRLEQTYGTRPTLDSAPMAWVRMAQMFASTENFGQEDTVFVPRRVPFRWGVEVELGVIRCVTTVQAAANQPVLPSAAEITADTLMITEDARALRHAVQYLQEWQRDVLWKPLQPIGPQGGTGGVTISIVVPFADCKPTIT